MVLAVALGGCSTVVMSPTGDIARQQADLIVWSVILMLLIIVPVMVLTVLFAWRYRASNEEATYEPDWDHSTGLELIIWSAPLLIIIALGAITWVSTHTLDPYRPLDRTAPGKPVTAETRPLEVQVVSLDWKWLFIYPEQGIATVNELVLPVDRPVRFRLSSSSVMNAFWVPSMAGMVYTMAGMETKLHAVLNKPGRFEGSSANYSGAGFSYMNFWTQGVDDAAFDRWVAEVKGRPGRLDTAGYLKLEVPSEKVPPMQFGGVEDGLFDRIVGMCVKPGTPCMEGMAHGGHAAVNDRPAHPDEPKGALMRSPEEKGTSPHLTAPRGPAPGKHAPGHDANRNMTRQELPAQPGAAVAARA
jgi:cytochrome o ubiquinol oxidase subunit II